MTLDPTWLFVSLIPGGIGFVLLAYGKKQGRWPHVVAGLLMMVYPYFTATLVPLVQHENLTARARTEAQVRSRGRHLALRDVLLLDELQQRFCRALVVEQNPADRVLPALGKIVGVDIEDFTARVVAEQHLVRQLADRCAAIHRAHGDRNLRK